jgi:hypothetical protein
MSNNIYNILGKLKGITDTAAPITETAAETVYENVEPRGSITEAVKSLESKFATFKESAKPDFLDVDKDGDKAEPFKKAVKDKKAVEEGTVAKPQTDLKKHSATAKRMAAQKKADKDWNDSQAAKQATNEGQGPYTLDDPKHPKFKANYEKFKKKNPDCKLADFVAAMRKKEKGLSESAYDEPEAPNADAIAKRKRLQALKDRQEDERDSYSDNKSNVRKVAGKAYGGAAQKDDSDKDDLDEMEFTNPGEIGATMTAPVVTPQAAAAYTPPPSGAEPKMPTSVSASTLISPSDLGLEEVAPPGAKAERMVKHIKKGYADDGKLTKREKGIAYATAWKAHNKGQVEEGVDFKDAGKIKNSAPNMKKAKPAMVKESRMMEETDYFYEKVGKALAEKNPTLDTASGDFVVAVRKEMIAQGIEPNRARGILLMDEDFLSDVATSYDHCCKEIAECGAPVNSHLGGTMQELDEIAALAGLTSENTTGAIAGGVAGAALGKSPAAVRVGAAIGDQLTSEGCNMEELDEAASRKDFRQVANLLANIPDSAKRAELAKHHAEIFKQQNPRFSFDKFYAAAGVNLDDALLPNPPAEITIDEADMSEGNEFSGALAAAKASGAKEFEVDGKKYTVKEDINVNITANGEEDALNLFRKLAGMSEVTPAVTGVAVPVDAETAIAQGMVEPVEVEVDEDRDIEYANTPNEKIGPVSAAVPSGDDMHKAKKSYSDKPYRGDNPMAVQEATDDSLWKKYSGMLKSLIK